MYKLVLAFRYLIKRPVSYLAFLAVAICVFIVVVVMTVMTGLVSDFRQKNHNFVGDCVVGTESLVGFEYYEDFLKVLEQADFIQSFSPVIKNYALLSPDWTDKSFGVEVIGIDPLRHSRTTGFGRTLYYRKDNPSRAFEPLYDTSLPGCVFGIDLLLSRDVNSNYTHTSEPAKRSFSISCVPLTSKGALAKAGAGVVNTKSFYYSDTSQSGLARVDGSVVYLPFEKAQMLCGMAGEQRRVSLIHIKFASGVEVDNGCRQVDLLWQKFVKDKSDSDKSNLLGTVTVQSWKDFRRPFIAAMEKEQTMLTVMFSLVAVTTVFIILVVFYMIISHKAKDIGILKSLGVSNGGILNLFANFAFLLGLLASGAGSTLAWLFLLKANRIESWLFEHFGFQLWDRTMYAIGRIPSRIDGRVLAVIIISAVISCLIGAFIPSWQASRLKPVETLQVNQL